MIKNLQIAYPRNSIPAKVNPIKVTKAGAFREDLVSQKWPENEVSSRESFSP